MSEEDKSTDIPRVPVSWGELIDKITILEIKSSKLKSTTALQNVKTELTLLIATANSAATSSAQLAALRSELKEINTILWNTEDRIRDKERTKTFDEEFIELARAIYRTNDKRAEIKRRINLHMNSGLLEEKSYRPY